MTSLSRLWLLILALGAAGCLSPPTYQDRPVDCATDADCAWMGEGATCAQMGLCSLRVRDPGDGGGEVDAGALEDGGSDGGSNADGGGQEDGGATDAGLVDGGPGDGGTGDGGDGGWVCPEPCEPPVVEIFEPAPDAAVSNPLVLTIKVSPGDLPLEEVSCNIASPGSAYALAVETGSPYSYTCTLPLDEMRVGDDFSIAVNALDVLFHAGTAIRWFTRKD